MVGLAVTRVAPNAALRLAIATLVAPTGFVFGVVMLSRSEEAGTPIHVTSWFGASEQTQGISYGALLACMAANVLFNAVVTWYAAQVRVRSKSSTVVFAANIVGATFCLAGDTRAVRRSETLEFLVQGVALRAAHGCCSAERRNECDHTAKGCWLQRAAGPRARSSPWWWRPCCKNFKPHKAVRR